MWIAGQMLEVVLAKPQTEKKFDAASPHNAVPHHNYIPHPGYGAFPMNPYAPLTAGYGAAAAAFQQQPMIYGRGPMPTGMQMVPMVLPDGQIGYVLQQPGVQAPPVRPRRNDRNNGAGGPQGRGGGSSGGGDDSNRGRRYRPY
uniref:RNA-binding region RNP-1 (RNA recognition motif); Calcium-binding EF-hand n=1 Tax=Solanum tuberosum TaxID=4113 RepID=M1AQM9_SOLTU